MSRAVPGRLHVLTDETVQARFSHEDLAALASRGGADCVQYREKRLRTTGQHVAVARRMADRLGETALIVNDRADVALAVEAAGVHLGREDLEPAIARVIVGDRRLIGGTANGHDEAVRVAASGVDYLGVGPVFGTASKANPAPTLGIDTLARIAADVDVPVIAIGNIDASRVAEVVGAGAHGIAVLGAVVHAADPGQATARLREALDNALTARKEPGRVR